MYSIVGNPEYNRCIGVAMKMRLKVLILLLISFLSLAVLVGPRLRTNSEFQVTKQPAIAFAEAEKAGKPIFLEFYAKW